MTPPGGTMKANRHYTQKDKLEIMDMKIASSACCGIKVEFLIDARHILLAITELNDEELKKVSRAMVEKELKRQLEMKGENWYISPIDYGESGDHYNLKEKLQEALLIGKKLFPDFFDTPNSVKFIKDS